MKRIIPITIAVLVLISLLFTGCSNPLFNPVKQDTGDGNFFLQLAIPNYDYHGSTSSAAVRAISPESQVIELWVSFDGFAWQNVWEGWLDDFTDQTTANGFFYTSVQNVIAIPAGTYAGVRVDLLDYWSGSGGIVLTSGTTAAPVTVTANGTTEISISLTPPSGMFTPLSMDVAYSGSVGWEGMTFYSFYATAFESYDITIEPTMGEPDIYLFNPDGTRPGTDKGFDWAVTEDPADTGLGITTIVSTYDDTILVSGNYYIGVYGWDNSSTFIITVSAGGAGTNRPTTTPDPLTEIEQYVHDAITAMKDGEIDDALTNFTLAHNLDPTYGPAFMGYNALYLMSMNIDADIRTMARDVLGLVDFPSTMAELYSAQWLQQVIYTYTDDWGDTYTDTSYLPRISGQDDYDGAKDGITDGVIDPYERLMAFLNYFINNNAEFNPLVDTVLNKLGDRLDFHVQQIMSMPSDVKMTFTWDMAFDDWETDVIYVDYGNIYYNWPVDNHGNPLEFVIGKADLLLLASTLEMLETMIYMAKVYNYNLLDGSGSSILVDFWNDFNPVDGTAPATYTSGTTPFLTNFLKPRDTSTADINASKNAFLDALNYIKTGLYEIKANPVERDGFTISSTSTSIPNIETEWLTIQSGMEFAVKVIDEAEKSITDPESDYVFYGPVLKSPPEGGLPDFDYYTYGIWPTSAVADESVGINLGKLFLNPLSFILDIGTDGEPVWYNFAPGSHFTPITAVYDPSQPFDSSPEYRVFGKVKDISLGGIIPIGNSDWIPKDDPSTRITLDMGDYDYGYSWSDVNYNDMWDPGEFLYWADIYPAIEGVIDFYNSNMDGDYPTGNPYLFYDLSAMVMAEVPDDELAKYTLPENYAALRTVLETDAWIDTDSYLWDIMFLYNTEFYSSIRAAEAWNSLAPAGTTAIDDEGLVITSTGSFWWWLLDGI